MAGYEDSTKVTETKLTMLLLKFLSIVLAMLNSSHHLCDYNLIFNLYLKIATVIARIANHV